jgi:hypothetical protein
LGIKIIRRVEMQKQDRWGRWALAAVFLFLGLLCINITEPTAQSEDAAKKFEAYRTAIKTEYGLDIREFKETLKGGKADGKSITQYDLKQILLGIKVELEHTSNKMLALEIVMDHLEEISDYYTHLEKMEKEAEAQAQKGKK